MAEINIIFGGSMSITSKMQGKKLQREISLAQRIEPGRRMKWFKVGISFGLEDHPDTKLSNRNLPVIPRSEKEGMKPPYVCPGCSNHTYSNNMITRFHVQ
jgi:hypothetical protein